MNDNSVLCNLSWILASVLICHTLWLIQVQPRHHATDQPVQELRLLLGLCCLRVLLRQPPSVHPSQHPGCLHPLWARHALPGRQPDVSPLYLSFRCKLFSRTALWEADSGLSPRDCWVICAGNKTVMARQWQARRSSCRRSQPLRPFLRTSIGTSFCRCTDTTAHD